eukprot:m.102464 g.102464  ORF g.102464 m.102464 type:complete len:103 (+) comp37174_c0_seq22:2244-2552(+)
MGDSHEALTITSYRVERFVNMTRNVRLMQRSLPYPDIIVEYINCEKDRIKDGFGRMRQGALNYNAEALHEEMIDEFALLIESVKEQCIIEHHIHYPPTSQLP